jgi:hypothetical protein
MGEAGHMGERERKSQRKDKLMASGWVCPQGNCSLPVEVKRGMSIYSREGVELGKLAAVVIGNTGSHPKEILLSRLPHEKGYWTVPVEWIEEVNQECLRLSTGTDAAKSLEEWHSPL